MTISYREFDGYGARLFTPEGPYGSAGNFPVSNFVPGSVVEGDAGSEYIFLLYNPLASVTLNQGDWLVWDNAFNANQSLLGAGYHGLGSQAGVFFLGGRFGDPASNITGQGNQWSYTFAATGVYGIWVQRAGGALAKFGTVTAQGDTAFTTATASSLSALASGASNSQTVQGVFTNKKSFTFTATTTAGSNVLTAVATNSLALVLAKGMAVAATNLNVGCVISDFGLGTVTLSNKTNTTANAAQATASGTTQTITVYTNEFWGIIPTSGGSTITAEQLYGIYPNQTLSGTSVGSSAVINSITGVPGAYTLNVSVVSSGAVTGTPELITATGYLESMLTWPWISAQN